MDVAKNKSEQRWAACTTVQRAVFQPVAVCSRSRQLSGSPEFTCPSCCSTLARAGRPPPPPCVQPNSDSPPGARPACLLPHPHSPHRFCCRRPGAFLSWHRHSSTSKLGSPLAENWLIPRESPMSGCFLQRKFAIKSQ